MLETARIADYGGISLERIAAKGRGLIAQREFARREVVASSPVILFEGAEARHINHTLLKDYVFWWPFNRDGAVDEKSNIVALVCGLGSLANHSGDPNCTWDFAADLQQHYLRAKRYILPGEEISIDYGWSEAQLRKLDVALDPAVVQDPRQGQ